MPKLTDELWSFCRDRNRDFSKQHLKSFFNREKFERVATGEISYGFLQIYNVKEIREAIRSLRKFLYATMDEVRLKQAENVVNVITNMTHMDDTSYFRRNVLKRELIGDISYRKQRDHAAHTLNNYLLGWYIFSNNMIMKNAMLTAIRVRYPDIDDDLATQHFWEIWPFVSLLHDIGYLFEGTLEATDTSVQAEMVKRGAAILRDYFNQYFWYENNCASAEARDRMRRITRVVEPEIVDDSLASIASSLCNLGNLKSLTEAVCHHIAASKCTPPGVLGQITENSEDAFDLWQSYYTTYAGSTSMPNRIAQLRKVFDHLHWHGLDNSGLRLLDHGVCSGLIALQYSTLYIRMLFYQATTLEENRDSIIDPKDKETWIKFSTPPPGITYDDASWWWKFIVWGTAATALHNIQQTHEECRLPGEKDLDPLGLDEDPLAFLGILVDILQEWDRYAVRRGASVGDGSLPLQGCDVSLECCDGKICLDYHDSKRADKIREALENALHNWSSIVEVLPISSKVKVAI